MSKEKILLKDKLFNQEKVNYVASILKKVYPKLNQLEFETDTLSKFPKLELKERMYWITKNLKKHLPDDYLTTLNILKQSLKNPDKKNFFIFASYSDYVEQFGCEEIYLSQSLESLGNFTSFESAEFAIRTFLNNFPNQTFIKMQKWSKNQDEHQRRLASEGLRPKLPWAKAIDFDYKQAATVLDNLFYDKSRYVTRSVANHLNDISKFDPNFVLEKLNSWKNSKQQDEKEMQYIINHSLRTLIKKGDVATLKFLGHDPEIDVNVNNLNLKSKKISVPGYLEFSFELQTLVSHDLIIDYKIIYHTPSKKISQKIFKIKKLTTNNNQIIRIEKRHSFKPMTTKRLYSGVHQLQIQVNGKIVAIKNFYLDI